MHVCYCHSPFRYAWFERQRAEHELPRPLRPLLRLDARPHPSSGTCDASRRVTHYIANSEAHSRQRIQRYWGRDATVVHPPVDVHRFSRRRSPRTSSSWSRSSCRTSAWTWRSRPPAAPGGRQGGGHRPRPRAPRARLRATRRVPRPGRPTTSWRELYSPRAGPRRAERRGVRDRRRRGPGRRPPGRRASPRAARWRPSCRQDRSAGAAGRLRRAGRGPVAPRTSAPSRRRRSASTRRASRVRLSRRGLRRRWGGWLPVRPSAGRA